MFGNGVEGPQTDEHCRKSLSKHGMEIPGAMTPVVVIGPCFFLEDGSWKAFILNVSFSQTLGDFFVDTRIEIAVMKRQTILAWAPPFQPHVGKTMS